ncbi:hypothetical protein DFP72DRAFT_875764 [Ephemerocybe angulata]|uniref:Uncharacterized protein n=1 Tax=Ephemerocybe angulata TaxID=980116 RepID=A0A8H6MBU5_9AGAR|nr:hypothetical protein DFP72DRAFT_913161 [Tulosesus angulatus]KAF6763473.1 hypothetical protein DFP72DRAFT_875764 [Tulosesus angulatus]
MILSAFAMWDFNRLKKDNEAICAKEGLDEKSNEIFKDAGNKCPLFRWVCFVNDIHVLNVQHPLLSLPQFHPLFR